MALQIVPGGPQGLDSVAMAQLEVPRPMAPLPVLPCHARCAQTNLSRSASPLQSAFAQAKSTRLASLPMPSPRYPYDVRDVLTVQMVLPAAFLRVMLELVLLSTTEAPLVVVSVTEELVITPQRMLLSR